MAKEAKTLDDLFHDTLKDIYYAEKKILATLPKMAKAAQSEEGHPRPGLHGRCCRRLFRGCGSPDRRCWPPPRTASRPQRVVPACLRSGSGWRGHRCAKPGRYLRRARGSPGATRPPGARDARAVGSTWDRAIDRRPGARAAPGPAQRGHCLVQVVRPYVVEKTRPDFRHVRRLSNCRDVP